ncbi:hypothetical protein THASP1DRAFT_26211 [Thamnocephalis sphaerospora]|uniref:Uncharacterized protein n=1 Tax=Thamnocephalis sphaerospora TaxID=78915 RepID=A0A4P9XHU7_9FUNG|nr:hypothetical protein THASP1DRAFT_26211 [Thamnocephalis sphaerospora]|eukprot:RKP05262.1 hypothetical protein THASP1DRAFT_26211 [Thamnocephalis sphaerospora]
MAQRRDGVHSSDPCTHTHHHQLPSDMATEHASCVPLWPEGPTAYDRCLGRACQEATITRSITSHAADAPASGDDAMALVMDRTTFAQLYARQRRILFLLLLRLTSVNVRVQPKAPHANADSPRCSSMNTCITAVAQWQQCTGVTDAFRGRRSVRMQVAQNQWAACRQTAIAAVAMKAAAWTITK